MTWNTEEILQASLGLLGAKRSDGDLQFPLFDQSRMVGVGGGGGSELVLMLPAQPNAEPFEAAYATYAPSVELYQPGETLQTVTRSLLICKFESSEPGHLQAICSIFSGLISLEMAVQNTADAIWAMKRMFDSGIVPKPSIQSVKGLFGELAVLQDYDFSPEAIRSWHLAPGSKFDFSSGNLRVEVKTTSGAVREHQFSEGQVPGPENADVFVASVLLQIVETGGISLAEYFLRIRSELTSEEFHRVLEISSLYLKTNPLAIVTPRVDLDGTLGTIRYFKSEAIPFPRPVQGVLDLQWTANLEGIDAQEYRPSFGNSKHLEFQST